MDKSNKHAEEEKKYNEMLKPITYTSGYDRKYKYRHEDLIWRSKYRAMKGRLQSLRRLHLLYDEDEKTGNVTSRSEGYIADSQNTPRELQNRLFVEDVGIFSVFSDDISTKSPSTQRTRLARDPKRLFRQHLHGTELITTQAYGGFDVPKSKAHYGIFKGNIPEIRDTTDGALRDYSKERVKMWNLDLRNDERFAHFNQTKSTSAMKKTKLVRLKSDKTTQKNSDKMIQTDQPVRRKDSLDLSSELESGTFREAEENDESKITAKLELKVDLDIEDVSPIDYLDGFDCMNEQDCKEMVDEIYFKPDEEVISSIYKLKSDIPSVQLMNTITVRIPVKIRFHFEKLKFCIRMKIGLIWRRYDASFEETPGNSLFEGYVKFKTEYRGHFFATCDFLQFTYKVSRYGYRFRNALIPDIQVNFDKGAVEEAEDITFQISLLDRERFSRYDDVSPRLIYPVVYVTDGLWIRRNKSLYSKKVAPLLTTISNDTSYGSNTEVYLLREKESKINIIGERSSTNKKFTVLLDSNHSTFWYVVTKEISLYKLHEPILERGFAVSIARTCPCKILTFHENRKEEFSMWVCIVEYPDVDSTISKFLGFNGVPEDRRFEMTENGGKSQTFDLTDRSTEIDMELDVNFKQRHYKKLPTLTFKVGHTCRVHFKVKCRINPLLCDDIEKYGIIRYFMGTKPVHEVQIDTARPVPEAVPQPAVPDYSKEAIEKLVSAESLHKIASCLSEDDGFEVAIRLGISAATVSKILIMYGSVESKNFRLFLLWKQSIKGDEDDVKDFINSFYDIDRGDIGLRITDALDNCQYFK